MLRVSTTTLESFRRVVATEWGDEAELIASIRGEPFQPTWQMEAGTAWHSVLEGRCSTAECDTEADEWSSAVAPVCGLVRSGKFSFDFQYALAAQGMIGPGMFEVKATSVYHGCTVVAKCDHIRGLTIQDNKTKFSQPDPRDYEQSLQWRFYLDVFGASVFRYNLWHFSEPDGGGYCEFKGLVTMRFWPYPNLRRDCSEWVERFLDWAHGRRLTKYLEREGSSVAYAA